MLIVLVGGLLERSTRDVAIVDGPLNLGGSLELIANPVPNRPWTSRRRRCSCLSPAAAR
ncbi:MAG TPA: hypothetical protein VGD07_05660 [Methylomirabilota bacterium]